MFKILNEILFNILIKQSKKTYFFIRKEKERKGCIFSWVNANKYILLQIYGVPKHTRVAILLKPSLVTHGA